MTCIMKRPVNHGNKFKNIFLDFIQSYGVSFKRYCLCDFRVYSPGIQGIAIKNGYSVRFLGDLICKRQKLDFLSIRNRYLEIRLVSRIQLGTRQVWYSDPHCTLNWLA